jgi:hypothetical protein
VIDSQDAEETSESESSKVRIANQIKRYIDYESLVPVPSRKITAAALEVLPLFIDHPCTESEREIFLVHTKSSFSSAVRKAAVRGIASMFLHVAPDGKVEDIEMESSWLHTLSWLVDLLDSDSCNIRSEIIEAIISVPQDRIISVAFSSTARLDIGRHGYRI